MLLLANQEIKLKRALEALDLPRADDVANKLRDLGYEGTPKDGHFCPIANYLKVEAGPFELLEVGSEFADVEFDLSGECSGLDGWYREQTLVMPRAAGDFTRKFDDHGYPDMLDLNSLDDIAQYED